MRYWLGRNGTIVLSIFILLVALICALLGFQLLRILTALGFAVPLVYSFESTRREKVRLFEELFDKFNRRYDQLNESLNAIVRVDDSGNLTTSEIDTLYDYFNLCGEEYLFFRLGYIHREAWEAWRNGMRSFYSVPRIAKVWEEELESGSYYGLHFKLLQSS